MRICCISDSPKLSTGFGNVAAQIYMGFHNAGHEVFAFGMLDPFPDINAELPYSFWPAPAVDLMGSMESMNFIKVIQPDIVWIMIDPGNLLRFTANMMELKKQAKLEFKIIAYPPIEGTPISGRFIEGFNTIVNDGGEVILWCKSAAKAAEHHTGESYKHVYFGSDHAPWERYPEGQRSKLRKNVGFDRYFIVGSIGTNKRTKGFDTLIYTAAYLKAINKHKDIKFYCHTEPNRPTMQGYNLIDLAQAYDVSDMMLWKPSNNVATQGTDYKGIDRAKPNMEELLNIEIPDRRDIAGKISLWESYSFISRLNCLDIYMDFSQVEGWGLPVGEAMSCGIPTFVPRDNHVRDEVFGGGAIRYEPLSERLWTTWHTGARLVALDPVVVAEQIIDAKERGVTYRKAGIDHMKRYKWENTQKEMCDIIGEYNE
jgi:glycosyltransferase involved in cell wall biosynthesis